MESKLRKLCAILLIGLFLSSFVNVTAQEMVTFDLGYTEPYHPALVHYRLGVYHLVRLEPEQAMAELDAAIVGLPDFGYPYLSHAVGCIMRGKPVSALGYLLRGNQLLVENPLPYQGVDFLKVVGLILTYQFT